MYITKDPCQALVHFEDAHLQLPSAWEVLANLAQSIISCAEMRKEPNMEDTLKAIGYAETAMAAAPTHAEVSLAAAMNMHSWYQKLL